MKLLPLTAGHAFVMVYTAYACPLPSGESQPTLAADYQIRSVATGLAGPRGLAFDPAGNLLVVEADTGTISAHTVSEADGCTTLTNSVTVVGPGLDLNYGIQVDGPRLYASNADKVFTWSYDVTKRTVDAEQTLISGMNTSGPAIRPLQLSRFSYNTLVVSRGAGPDIDSSDTTIAGGTAQIRAFNPTQNTGVQTWEDGQLIAWGVRSPTGLAEHPTTGGWWSTESGVDNTTREGVDVSAHNPADELNSYGPLASPSGANYGYPFCHAVWDVAELPSSSGLNIGDQFATDPAPALGNQAKSDQECKSTTGPRLSFPAHSSPVDLKFSNSGDSLWVSFYGAWTGKGGEVSIIQFQNGEPTEPAQSTESTKKIVFGGSQRFLGMAVDASERLFVSTYGGEILMITKSGA